ncbi:glycosyltransferase [Vibrio parahaemolyticus]|uniref:Putative glycosyltransferase EpsD n=1 Tax=Vibrio parahaemolyticus TaxID=670 RepID=A0A7M1WCG7_VIBPH|nr:glycosyltransferase [Vibrio parahaemolyticus]ELA7156572.1 glycosyltransferase [Vibrio parahaemolyticus]ELB2919086.1 glycosyltransferase [Vibrio parahaemolyticus]MCR9851994.1 glycosyltransferase [Vibrio parahaemolyticus]MDF4398131.1 glycosyltransferase [Vibrio parahaemolyticus]MDF4733194.1 glycosyltransferase [Vibrio parahaemolyticus]
MKKTKILYVVSTLKRCGPNNQLFNIINNLDKNRFSPHVLTISNEENESFKERFLNAGIQVSSLSSHRVLGLFTIRSRINKFISKISPDVIHTQGYRADRFIQAAKSNKELNFKHLCTVRNIPQEDYVMTYGKVLGKVMFKRHIDSLMQVDKVVGVSEVVYSNLHSYCELKNTTCINNGVDIDLYQPALGIKEIQRLRYELDLPQDEKVFISTGHLSLRKDPDFLIEGFIDSKLSNSHLVLVGDGELKEFLAEKYKSFSCVKFVGRSNRISDYLKASDYYVSCSKSEGLPNSVLEAMASGLPCVLSDIEPHTQIVTTSLKDVGCIYGLGSKTDFLKALKQTYETDKLELSKNARDLTLASFSAGYMSNKYQDLYLKLLDIT